MKVKIEGLFFLVLLLFSSCAYNKADEEGENIPNVAYSVDVKPIIVQNCYTCHSDTATHPNKPGYAFFNNFDELKNYALSTSTVNSNYTKLQARIRHIEFPGMPLNKPQLSEQEMVTIENWIKQGAPNN